MSISRNEYGFSLLEVMVATGISFAVLTGSMKLMKMSQKLKSESIVKSDINSKLSLIQKVFSDPESCSANFSSGSLIELKSNKIIYKSINGNIVEYIKNNTEGIREKVLLRDFKIAVSREYKSKFSSDLELSSVPDSSIFELKISFDTRSKIVVKKIPINISYDNDGTFLSCSSSLNQNELSRASVLSTIANCSPGYIFNGDQSNPSCVIDSGIQHISIAKCDKGSFLKGVSAREENGVLKFSKTCAHTSCKNGELGYLEGSEVKCIKCKPGEVLLVTENGPICSLMSCSDKDGLKYLNGINEDGVPTCLPLVENYTQKCSKNGFKLIVKSIQGSIKPKCCDSCPSAGNVCEGTLASITSDCENKCMGRMKRKPMEASEWGECETDSTEVVTISKSDAASLNITSSREESECTEKRTITCKNPDANNYQCCIPSESVERITRPCFNGHWLLGQCHDEVSDDGAVIEAVCEKGKCCDPERRPNTIVCGRKLPLGKHTIRECLDSGGKIISSPLNFLCAEASNFPALASICAEPRSSSHLMVCNFNIFSCPSSWTTVIEKIYFIRIRRCL